MNQIIQYCNEPATISRLRDSQFIEVNDSFLEVTGYRREEVLGRTALQLGLWPNPETYRVVREKLLEAGAVRRLPVNLRDRSGGIRRCVLSAVVREVSGEQCCISFVDDISDRLRAEEDLARSEGRFRSYVETASDGFTVLDDNGDITFVGHSVERLLGVPAKDVIGRNFRAFVHPDDQAIAERSVDLKDRAAPGETATFRVQRTDQNWIWIEGRGNRMPQSGAVPASTVFTWHDITEKIEQSERLRATEQQLTHIVNHAPIVINEFDNHGVMTMRAGHPVPGEEFGLAAVGKSMFETFAESPAIVRSLTEVLSGRKNKFTVELRGQWFDVWAEPLRRPDGSVRGGMAVSADVTDRVAAEQSLQAEREQFRTLVDNSTDIVVLLGRDGRLLFANPTMEKYAGYNAQDFLDRGGASLINADDLDQVKRSLDAAFANPGTVVNFRFRGRLKNGEARSFQVSGKVMPGRPDQVIVQARDVTAQEVYETELKRARDAAMASARLQSAFVANISHEVRTPLNVILGYLDLLAEHLGEQGDATQDEYIETAARAGQRLAETISNVLDYSRVEAGLFESRLKPMLLADFVASRVEQFRSTCLHKGLELRFIDEAAQATVLADEYCVSVILRNLLDNAVKFTEAGAITVRQFRTDSEVCIEIQDTGVGMETEFLARVFAPFVQEDAGFTRNFEGSGLGLALTKRMLDFCNARITARSEKGWGSVFTLSFPMAAATRASQPQAEIEAQLPGRPQLLVVEDDAPTQKMMRVLLEEFYDVRIAADLEDVKKILRRADPPLAAVLMDISLRGAHDGLHITRFLRTSELFGNLPIVAVTAHASSEHRRLALEAGCDLVLTKPILREQILTSLEQASRTRSSGIPLPRAKAAG